VPWRGKTLVGVWHKYSKAKPDRISVSREELLAFLTEINAAYDGLNLQLEDITMINTGLILFGDEDDQSSESDHSFAKRSVLVDHAGEGMQGLVSVVGARATVARGIADKTIDIVDRRLSRSGKTESTAWHRIYGGSFDDFQSLAGGIQKQLPDADPDTIQALAHNHGAAWTELLDVQAGTSLLQVIPQSHVLQAEIVHAIRHEMATSLADIVFRRTELGTAGDPGADATEVAADIAAGEFGWDAATRSREIATVREILDKRGPWCFVDHNNQLPAGE
jgi:glycerol-3-phosphate dehydrogenase